MLMLSLAFLGTCLLRLTPRPGEAEMGYLSYHRHSHHRSLLGFRHWFEFSFQLLVFLSLLLGAPVFPPLSLASWTFVNDNQMLISGECLLGARHRFIESSRQSCNAGSNAAPIYTGRQILRLEEVQ